MKRAPALIALGALLLPLAWPAAAGQSCTERPVTTVQLDRALHLAGKVIERLPASEVGAVILARVGSDVSEHGLRWTHAGLVYRTSSGQHWQVLHKLNYCGRDSADLYRQGLGNFFLDDPEEWRAWLLTPTPEVQRQLLAALDAGAAQSLNDPHYSMIAYPFALDYQNSNQWLLELLAVAMDPALAVDRRTAQAWLQHTGYRPGTVQLGPWQRLGASIARPNISFADHPIEDRMRGRYKLVTVESLEQYLRAHDLLTAEEEIRLPGATFPNEIR